MRTPVVCAILLTVTLLTSGASAVAQIPGAVPGANPAPATPQRVDDTLATTAMMRLDPIGDLLERRDSLELPDSVVQRLVQLNLRLFRRNRAVQMRIDSLMPRQGGSLGRTAARPSQEVMDRAAPLIAQLRAQTAAARDTALAWLTDEQRAKVADLERRQADRRNMRRRS